MVNFARIIFIGSIVLTLASCSATSSLDRKSEPEIFRVGELEVWLFADRARMIQSLPPVFTLLAATRSGNQQVQVSGYFDKERKRIYAINDARTVIHEFKHYLEPEWHHALNAGQESRVMNQPATK